MAIFEKENSPFQNGNYRHHLDNNWQNGNGEFDAVNHRIDGLGDTHYPNSNEVINACVDKNGKVFKSLSTRLDADQAIAENVALNLKSKAEKSDVEELFKNIIPGSPKGTFASLDDLRKLYPNGAAGIYVTTDNGHWYYYNSGWQDGGTYQATAVADNSITNQKLEGGITSNTVDKINTSSIDFNYLSLSGYRVTNGIYVDRSGRYGTDYIGVAFSDASDKLFIPLNMGADTNDLVFYFTHLATDYDSQPTLSIDFADKSYNKISNIYQHESTGSTLEGKLNIPFDDIPKNAKGIVLSVNVKATVQAYLYMYDPKIIPDEATRGNLTNYLYKMNNIIQGGKRFMNVVSLWNTSKGKVVNNDYFCHYIADSSTSNTSNAGIKIRGRVDPTRDAYISVTGSFLSNRTDNQQLDVFLMNSNGSPIIKAGKLIFIGKLDRKVIKTIQLKVTPAQMKQYGINGILYCGLGGKTSEIIVTDIQIGNQPFGEGLNYAVSKINSVNQGEESIGQPLDLIEKNDFIAVNELTAGTPQGVVDVNSGIVTEIQAFVSNAGDRKFYIGSLDQNSLLVNQRSFTLYLDAGLNQLDVTNQKIEINHGEQLFIDLKNEKVYVSSDEMPAFGQGLIQDESHTPSDANYSGYIFYETNNIVPLSYSVKNVDYLSATKNVENSVNLLNDRVVDLSKQNKAIISSPNGNKFRLTVSNDGALTAVKINPAVVRVFGNSITTHPMLQGIGMAASDKTKDWPAIFSNYVKTANATADFQKFSISNWESKTNSVDRDTVTVNEVVANIPENTDYVVLQLGDNVNTADKHSTFGADIKSLISAVKAKATHASVYLIGVWFTSFDDLISLEQSACDSLGATFVNINDLMTPDNQSAIGNVITLPDGTKYNVIDNGVVIHPGDKGHQAIANRLIAKLDF